MLSPSYLPQRARVHCGVFETACLPLIPFWTRWGFMVATRSL